MEDKKNIRMSLHELNNILTIIMSTTDLLMLDAESNEQMMVDLKNIVAACENGRALVEEIRTGLLAERNEV